MPRFRPRLPDVKAVVGTNNTPALFTLGRSFELCKSPLESLPVKILNGRPEEISTIGARVKSDKKRCRLLDDLRHDTGEVRTPLKTKRCRWSKSELARSARKFRLS